MWLSAYPDGLPPEDDYPSHLSANFLWKGIYPPQVISAMVSQ